MSQVHSYVPKEGFVPNAKTATSIGNAVLIPIYGEENIKKQRPLKAVLLNGKWTVTGRLKEGWLGGVALVEISKSDGRILRVSHGK